MNMESAFIQYLKEHDILSPKKCMRWAFGNGYRLDNDMYAKWNGRHGKLGTISDYEEIKNAFGFITLCYKQHQMNKVNKRLLKGGRHEDHSNINKLHQL